MKNPKVSIIIPTYKDHEGLNKALESVVNQTYENLEIIVVNDCPGEEISNYIEVKDSRIKTIDLEENKGGTGEGARNVGIEKASGSLLFFLDSDDELRKDTIEKLVEKYNQGFDAVTCWGKEMKSGELMRMPKQEENLHKRSLEVCIFIPPGPLISKEDMVEIGRYKEIFAGDRDLAIRVSKKFDIGVVKEPLYIYDARTPEDIKTERVKRLKIQKDLLENYPAIKNDSKAYSNLCRRMAIGYMLKDEIKTSRHYFRQSLKSNFSFGTLLTYLTTFLPKICRDLIFKTIERNKNLLKEMGY